MITVELVAQMAKNFHVIHFFFREPLAYTYASVICITTKIFGSRENNAGITSTFQFNFDWTYRWNSTQMRVMANPHTSDNVTAATHEAKHIQQLIMVASFFWETIYNNRRLHSIDSLLIMNGFRHGTLHYIRRNNRRVSRWLNLNLTRLVSGGRDAMINWCKLAYGIVKSRILLSKVAMDCFTASTSWVTWALGNDTVFDSRGAAPNFSKHA